MARRRRAAPAACDGLGIDGDEDVISADLATTGQDLARFRNLLVHGYAVVDDTHVASIVRDRRDDPRSIAAALAACADD